MTTKPKTPAAPAVPPPAPSDTISDWLHKQPAAKAKVLADYHELRRVGTPGNAIPDHDKPYMVELGDGSVWERR